MNTKFLLPMVLVGLAVLVILVIPLFIDTGAVREPTGAAAPRQAPEPTLVRTPASAPAEEVSQPVQSIAVLSGPITSVDQALRADTAGDESARTAVLAMIEEAMVTYSEEGLVVLGPLLRHPDPAIRAAAIDGVVQLGETSGAKVLREASRRVGNSSDAAKMIEAAEFLELPVFLPSSR